MARRWKRVRFSIFLCFFLRMRLRRFLIRDPMAPDTLPAGVPVRTNSDAVRVAAPAGYARATRWRVVQLAERLTLDQEVAGSIPAPPATPCLVSGLGRKILGGP